jgi:outer membrane lipase/esterase
MANAVRHAVEALLLVMASFGPALERGTCQLVGTFAHRARKAFNRLAIFSRLGAVGAATIAATTAEAKGPERAKVTIARPVEGCADPLVRSSCRPFPAGTAVRIILVAVDKGLACVVPLDSVGRCYFVPRSAIQIKTEHAASREPTSRREDAAGLVGLGLAAEPSSSAAQAFDGMVVFGDSLSDSGNAGRFSNGPNWAEQLAERLKVPLRPSQAGGTNFAVGGARLDAASGPTSLRNQADLYLRRAKPAGRVLHIVYGGGNDLLGAAGAPDGHLAVERAVRSLKTIISDLAQQGATDVLVPNLQDVGLTPGVGARGERALAQARALTQSFNVALDAVLRSVGDFPNLRVHRLDVYGMGERVRANPSAVGYSNITSSCNTLASCDGYLFWDHIHPTTRAHARIADAAFRILSEQ